MYCVCSLCTAHFAKSPSSHSCLLQAKTEPAGASNDWGYILGRPPTDAPSSWRVLLPDWPIPAHSDKSASSCVYNEFSLQDELLWIHAQIARKLGGEYTEVGSRQMFLFFSRFSLLHCAYYVLLLSPTSQSAKQPWLQRATTTTPITKNTRTHPAYARSSNNKCIHSVCRSRRIASFPIF